MTNRAVTFTKHHTPNSLRVMARRVMSEAHHARLRLTVGVNSPSEYQNVYHCAVRKTASQWLKAMFNDPIVYRYSGLLLHDPRPYKWRCPQAFPPGRSVSTLFLSHARFMDIPKPDAYRAFFVLRDPRDIVVSSYFSTRTTHTPMGDVSQVRKVLQEKSQKEGLLHLIGHHSKKGGAFKTLRSWVTAPPDEAVILVRYEDLTGEQQTAEVDRLLRHSGIHLPSSELTDLLSRYSFSRMRGNGDAAATISHYRKGQPGDWRHHFDDDISEAFTAATGDLVELLGYSPTRSAP